MRRFSAEYLARTRAGMWADSRAALADLALDSRDRIVDVGCGTGELSGVLREESEAEVVGVDADTDLLAVAREELGGGDDESDDEFGGADSPDFSPVAGDATRLPLRDDCADLVVCQALLVNLPDPTPALREFARVSSDLVAAVEPNNAEVGVDSTVDREVTLESQVREAYLAGVETDVALGETVARRFRETGLSDVRTRTYYHEKRVEPPYDEHHVESARQKATGEGLDRHETELRRQLTSSEFDALRREWREMGREVVGQMADGDYRRVEVVPFEVTVGRVGG
ncbi:class I SAM-dependent methyltransferase [Salinirubrum litoreum]|uniref:Class I SAM-dependent methyltransferase n=1 Tax=Salinirubrum litoreum TaxID=1126234 RepID=A0ABD5R609_9EURY|nr:class I SAM-dependent methyltransferase [Salinirubrum litoreum]